MEKKKEAITLKTVCDLCVHNEVCRYQGNAKTVMDVLKNMKYGDGHGPNSDQSWEYVMQCQNINISFSCQFYRRNNGY